MFNSATLKIQQASWESNRDGDPQLAFGRKLHEHR
jgi:hypothetical protein